MKIGQTIWSWQKYPDILFSKVIFLSDTVFCHVFCTYCTLDYYTYGMYSLYPGNMYPGIIFPSKVWAKKCTLYTSKYRWFCLKEIFWGQQFLIQVSPTSFFCSLCSQPKGYLSAICRNAIDRNDNVPQLKRAEHVLKVFYELETFLWGISLQAHKTWHPAGIPSC